MESQNKGDKEMWTYLWSLQRVTLLRDYLHNGLSYFYFCSCDNINIREKGYIWLTVLGYRSILCGSPGKNWKKLVPWSSRERKHVCVLTLSLISPLVYSYDLDPRGGLVDYWDECYTSFNIIKITPKDSITGQPYLCNQFPMSLSSQLILYWVRLIIKTNHQTSKCTVRDC